MLVELLLTRRYQRMGGHTLWHWRHQDAGQAGSLNVGTNTVVFNSQAILLQFV